MKIYDCFMYFDEEMILDLRLNILDKYVDYFVIVESIFNHKGDKRNLQFNPKKFEKFKEKIIYLTYDENPMMIEKVYENDSEGEKSRKFIFNAAYRENGQRNFISNGLKKAKDEDIILISDVDEIPNLEKLDLNNTKKKIILFKQDMFYYKFNLKLPNLIWAGTKACKKKNLLSPQWLRNIKDKKFSFFRIDTFFSKTKYINIKFIDDGGWHFTNLISAEDLYTKLTNFGHHDEFELSGMTVEDLQSKINNKEVFFNHFVDKEKYKERWNFDYKLKKIDNVKLPKFLQSNETQTKLDKWFD